jgi:hypothetical protein
MDISLDYDVNDGIAVTGCRRSQSAAVQDVRNR